MEIASVDTPGVQKTKDIIDSGGPLNTTKISEESIDPETNSNFQNDKPQKSKKQPPLPHLR